MTLPLGPMTSPTLSIGMWIVVIFGARRGDLVAGRGDGRVHHVEDLQASDLGLIEGCGQDVGGDAVDLGVQLQGGDGVGCPGDLEVHVTEGVLGTEDVRQRRVRAVGEDETHGDSGDRRLDRHTGVHQRQAGGADRPHRGRAVGAHHLGHEAQGVGELLLVRHDRQDRPPGESAVADLAPLRRADAAGLPVGPRRHVVVVQEALGGLRVEGVHELVHARHGQRAHVEHLGLTPLEQTRTVGRRQDADLGRHGTQVGRAAPVDAHALVDDALADELLGEGADGFLDLLLPPGELAGASEEPASSASRERRGLIGGGVALGLAGDRHRLGQLLGRDALDSRDTRRRCSRGRACTPAA